MHDYRKTDNIFETKCCNHKVIDYSASNKTAHCSEIAVIIITVSN